MFYLCRSLEYLDISNFNIQDDAVVDDLFSDCTSLEILKFNFPLKNDSIKQQILYLSNDNLTICNLYEDWGANFQNDKKIICYSYLLSYEDNNMNPLKCYTRANSKKEMSC